MTDHGVDILRRYREMEDKAAASVTDEMEDFADLLAPDFPRD